MAVTLEVSKLSGWLNACASCRESRKKGTWCGARNTGRGAAGGGRPRRSQRAGERARLQIGGKARGRAHVEHLVHGCDAGGVEAQWLVERRRALPSAERRAYDVLGRGEGYRERPESAGHRGARSAQGRARVQIGRSAPETSRTWS
eukprot:scaffold78323_cov43-Phaeocystis_antarctica.AAC.1